VRRLSGIAFPGKTYPGTALLADALIRTSVPGNEAHVHVHRAGVVTMFPMDERLRRIVVIAPGESLPQSADRMALQARLRAAGYTDSSIDEIVWSNAFRVHRRIAPAMRAGNVFLAGDSVHTHSPVGGQGMNIGLHDAFNLSGKLARVLSGDAPESLLDAYERERLPVARAVLRRTDVLTRALAGTNPLVRLTRERIAPALAGLPIVYGPVIRRLSLTA
jgi:2-polyprenyl-6-methoxyphenol hydroxylase-like FAD-dependent oxidoreductase